MKLSLEKKKKGNLKVKEEDGKARMSSKMPAAGTNAAGISKLIVWF